MPLGTFASGTATMAGASGGGGSLYLGPETGIKPTTGTTVQVLLDLKTAGEVSNIIVADGFDTMSVQAYGAGINAGSPVDWTGSATLQGSLGGEIWVDTATVVSGAGITRAIDIDDLPYLRWKVTGASGTSGEMRGTLLCYLIRTSK